MRRRLILHIGPHKTGSTYLQRRLQQDREPLLAHLGGRYPRASQDVLFGHHSLARLFRDAGDHSRELDALRRELEDCRTAVLSSEGFSRLDRTQLAHVRDCFSDFDVEVVAYLRVRSELLVSYWAESIKHGRDHGLPEFLAHVLVAPYSHPLINQSILLDTVSEIFGQRHLRVLVYRPGVDLYAEFLERILEAPAFLAHSVGRNVSVNPSFPMYATECLRLLHHTARAAGWSDSRLLTHRFRLFWETPGNERVLSLLRRAFEAHAATLDLAGIDLTFRHLDEELVTRYGASIQNAAPPAEFPNSRVNHVKYLRDLDATTAGDLVEALARIHRAVTLPRFRWPRLVARQWVPSTPRAWVWRHLLASLAGRRRR